MTVDRTVQFVLYAVAVSVALLLLRYVQIAPLGHDEIEHAHVSWRLLQGAEPYADFHQNHAPAVWWLGAAALRTVPHTIDGLFALRWLGIGALAIAIAAGWRILGRLKPDTDPSVYPLFLVAVLCLAFRLEWYRFRPDPFMSACAALALVAIARPELTHRSSLLAGAWFGLGAGFSPKLWPLLLLLPARALWRGWRTRSPGPLAHLASYALGGVLGAAPVLVWLTAHQLWNPFLVEVVAFNSAYPKPPDGALGFLRRPLLLAAIAGAGVMGWRARTERAGTRWPLAATAGATLLGLSAILSTVQSATYNVQVATVPASVAFAFAGAAIAGRRASLVRLIFLAMFLTVSVRREVVGMLHPGVGPGDIATPDLVALMDLARARPGGGCVGFAPCHPVFCKGPAEVSLLWDVVFLHHPDPGFRARQRGYFEQAIAEIPRSRPSVVVGECLGKNPWKEAVRNGAAGEEALRVMLHELAAGYQIHANRSSLVWAR